MVLKSMSITKDLRRSVLFEQLEEKDLDELSGFCRKIRVDKKAILFNEGDEANGFYLLLTGRFAIFKLSDEGKEQILHFVEPGQTFAEGAVFAGGAYPASARSLNRSELIFIPRKEFMKELRNKPDIAIRMLYSMSLWLKRMVELAEDLSLKDVEARFLRFIKNAAKREGKPLSKGTEVELGMEKSVIAAKINAVPETFSRMLKKLSTKKIIEVTRTKIKIIDPGPFKDLG